MTNATLTAAEGVADVRLEDRTLLGIPRSLYLYENKGIQGLAVAARSLYVYENKALWAISVLARSLYVYENKAIQALTVAARSLYVYEAAKDGEVFPWLMALSPGEQVVGGQVDLYGDGLGSIVEVGATATLTASSTNGANVAGNAVDRTQAAAWISNDGAAAWLRFTFAVPQVVIGLSLTDRISGSGSTWGIPLFRFSDLGADVGGAAGPVAPFAAYTDAEYPVAQRTYYALPAPRTCTWVEVRVGSFGSGGNRGLSEAWVYADQDIAAEDSHTYLRTDEMGIVAWTNRSPGLYPANGGVPIKPAATVTVPPLGESGLVTVVENT